MITCLSCSSCARTHIQTFICESSQILCDGHTKLYKKMSWSGQWGNWQHELYQQIHSSEMSRPSHLCICQYIQHPLPSLVECSIPSSRCGHVWMSKICSCVKFFGAPNSYAPNALATSSTFSPFCHPTKSSYSSFCFVAINSQSKMTICNIISNENMKYKQLKLSQYLSIYTLWIRLIS
jgi:hypothetical protein